MVQRKHKNQLELELRDRTGSGTGREADKKGWNSMRKNIIWF